MIYTAAYLSRRQTTSSLFSDKGANNMCPAPVSESRIALIRSKVDVPLMAIYSFMTYNVMSFMMGMKVTVGGMKDVLGLKSDVPTLAPLPQVIVTFQNKKVGDTRKDELTALHFTSETSNSYRYYRGTATPESVDKLLKMEAQADAYTPYGLTNIDGYLLYIVLCRTLNAVFGFISNVNITLPYDDSDDSVDATPQHNAAYRVTKLEELPHSGIFFPYFAGLVQPDKAMTIQWFLSTFSVLFGNVPKDVTKKATTFMSGWSSLSTTDAGMMFSHMVYGIKLALDTAAHLKPVYVSGDYAGFVIHGTGIAALQGSTLQKQVVAVELWKEISSINGHAQALLEIAEILSGIQLDSEKGKFVKISPASITSTRKIHNLCKERSIDGPTRKTLQSKIDATSFRENYWPITNSGRVAQAIHLLIHGLEAPEDAPFLAKGACIITKDPIISVLAAFGPRAPSLRGKIPANATIAFSATGKFYENFKGVPLGGIPTFAKPLQEAAEEWTEVIRDGTVWFKHSGSDKSNRPKISNLSMIIEFDSVEFKGIIKDITGTLVPRIGNKKRERDVTEEGEKSRADAQRKKAAATGERDSYIAGILQTTAASTSMEVDAVRVDLNDF